MVHISFNLRPLSKQCVRIVSIDNEDLTSRYPDINQHIGETGRIKDILVPKAGHATPGLKEPVRMKPYTEDKCYVVELDGNGLVNVPPEALEVL